MMQPQNQQRKTRRRAWVIGTSAVIVALVAGLVGGYFLFLTHPNALAFIRKPSSANVIHGQVPADVKHAKDQGEVSNPNMQLHLSISLPLLPQKQRLLQEFLATRYDPNSPFYHKFLSPQDYQSTFGLPTDTITHIKDFLNLSGLTVNSVSPTGQIFNVTGDVATIEKIFGVQLHNYTLNGQTYYAPTSDPHNPLSSLISVQSISGLDNFTKFRSCTVAACAAKSNASGNGYSAADLQKAYNASGLLSKGFDGSGQSIAFLELDGYNSSDIQQYQQQNSLSGGTFETVSVDGANNDSNPGQGAVEVELDMEVAFAMAPKVHEYVYEGPNSGQGINDVYTQIVNDNKAKIVSISWGLCEASSGSAELQTLDTIFKQGAAEGITFFAAAGDDGAYDCGDTNLGVDSPADDPNVTGVGGTSLTLGSNGGYGSEQAWSCTDANCTSQAPQGAGGGGGISQNFPVPSFQQGLNPPGTSGQTGRYVPDVSADADPQNGYAIVCTVSAAQCGGSLVVGGTSAAAPLWAGGTALVAQSLAKAGKSLGNTNQALYALQGKGFHDVTQGNNLNYQAAQGYDLATGWGSPDFAALADAIASGSTGTKPPTGNPTPTPTPGQPTATPNPGGAPTATPTSGPTQPTGNGQELLQNNGFENGTSPWVESSQAGYELIQTQNPHSGSYSALLCAYANCQDIIAQGFTVPSGFSSITLSYWYDIQTNKSGSCSDHLTVGIYTVNSDGTLGSQLGQAQDACNTNASNGYQQKTVDLTSGLQGQDGQYLAVVFQGTTDSNSNTTGFYIDDVSMQAQ